MANGKKRLIGSKQEKAADAEAIKRLEKREWPVGYAGLSIYQKLDLAMRERAIFLSERVNQAMPWSYTLTKADGKKCTTSFSTSVQAWGSLNEAVKQLQPGESLSEVVQTVVISRPADGRDWQQLRSADNHARCNRCLKDIEDGAFCYETARDDSQRFCHACCKITKRKCNECGLPRGKVVL